MKTLKNNILVLSLLALFYFSIIFLLNLFQQRLFDNIFLDLFTMSIIIISFILGLRTTTIEIGKFIGFFEKDDWEFRTKKEQNIYMKKNPTTYPLSIYVLGSLFLIGDILFYIIYFINITNNILFIFSIISILFSIYKTIKSFYMLVLFNNKYLD